MSKYIFKVILLVILVLSITGNVYFFVIYADNKAKINSIYNVSLNTYIDEFSQIYNKQAEIGKNLTYENLVFLLLKLHSAKATAFSADMALNSGASCRILVNHFLDKVNSIYENYQKGDSFTENDNLEYKHIFEEMSKVKVSVNIELLKNDAAAKERLSSLLNELEQNKLPLKNIN